MSGQLLVLYQCVDGNDLSIVKKDTYCITLPFTYFTKAVYLGLLLIKGVVALEPIVLGADSSQTYSLLSDRLLILE